MGTELVEINGQTFTELTNELQENQKSYLALFGYGIKAKEAIHLTGLVKGTLNYWRNDSKFSTIERHLRKNPGLYRDEILGKIKTVCLVGVVRQAMKINRVDYDSLSDKEKIQIRWAVECIIKQSEDRKKEPDSYDKMVLERYRKV